MKRLEHLVKQLPELHEKVAELKFTQNRIDQLEEEIKTRKHILRGRSTKFVYDNFDAFLSRFPDHEIPEDREIQVTNAGKDEIVKLPLTSDKKCSDKKPFNVDICPRCTLLYFKNLIEKEVVNYFL